MMIYYIVPAFLLFMAGRAFEPVIKGRKVPAAKRVGGASATFEETAPEAT
jgi:hypothetical protein